MKGQLLYILSASVVFIGILYGTDQWLQVDYITKSMVKIGLLAMILTIYGYRFRRNIIGDSIKNFRETRTPRYVYLIGISLILMIVAAYLVLRGFVDEEKILVDFQNKYEIGKDNFIYYGFYLSLVNSMFEEVFFRGFLFLEIIRMKRRRLAYAVSATLFSLYHLANISGWFNPAVFAVTLFGLLMGGLLFNYLDEKNRTFLNSYFVHICADIGIVVVGAMIFVPA